MIKKGTSKYASIWGKAVHIDHSHHKGCCPFHERFKPCFQIALLEGSLPGHDCRLTAVRAGSEDDGLCGSLYPGSLHI